MTVYSDHMVAVWLHQQENPTKRAVIFQDHLRQKMFWMLEHLSGKDNPVADFLSRFLDLEEQPAPTEDDPAVPEIMVQVPKMLQFTTRAQTEAKRKAEEAAAGDAVLQGDLSGDEGEEVDTKPRDTPRDTETGETLATDVAPAQPVPPLLWDQKRPQVFKESDLENDPNWPFWTKDFLDKLREEQIKDPILIHVFKYMDNPKYHPEGQSLRRQFNQWMKGGRDRYSINSTNLLVFNNFYAGNADMKIVVSESMREEIISHYHGPDDLCKTMF